MPDIQVQPAGSLTGYVTMENSLSPAINNTARTAALLRDQPYLQAQQAAQTQGQNLTNQYMPLTMQNQTYGSPFQQQQFQQQSNQLAVQNQLAQQNAMRQYNLEQLQAQRMDEYTRHNMAQEDLGNQREKIAALAADPFNLSGMNPGAAGGVPTPPGQQPISNQPQAPGQQPQGAPPVMNNIRAAMLDPNVTGDAFLKQLPVPMSQMVQAMVDGRQAPPSSFALKSPYWQGMLQAANKYDPSFDQTIWNARVQTRKSFSPGGKDMQNLNSMNTLIGHLGTLQDATDALANGDIQGVNSFVNGVKTFFGSPKVTNFETAKNAVGNELMRVFMGVGSGSEKEIQSWKQNFDSSNSPAQLQGAIGQAAQLLESRLQTVNHSYEQGMGKQQDVLSMVYPKSRAVLASLEQRSGVPTQAPPTAPPAQATTPANVPPVGRIIQGYRFKGGDPSDQNNWDKI